MAQTPSTPAPAETESSERQLFFHTPIGLLTAALILSLLDGIALVLRPYATAKLIENYIPNGGNPDLWSQVYTVALWVPILIIAFVALVYFFIGSARWAMYGADGTPAASNEAQLVRLLEQLNDRVLISDAAKRIVHRERDREALRRAIKEDIAKHDFEAAMVLVTQMSQTYGYCQEAEEFREEIIRARAAEMEAQIRKSMDAFERLLQAREWDKASAEAAKVQRLFPDAPQVRDLGKRVRDAREVHKQNIEREFLEAAQRDDVEKAMDLLKELDLYLTEAEAEPFRETARGVIGKKRQNLGVQFKIAVHDKEWTEAVRIGEQIIREFPNTKMADEVRGLIDLVRERSAGQQAARPREVAT